MVCGNAPTAPLHWSAVTHSEKLGSPVRLTKIVAYYLWRMARAAVTSNLNNILQLQHLEIKINLKINKIARLAGKITAQDF